MEAAGGEAGGSGGGGSPADAGAGGSSPPAAAPAPAPQPSGQGGPANNPAPAPAADLPNALKGATVDEAAKFHFAPEKFRVMGEDGSLDLEQTLAKVSQSYGDLERARGAAQGSAPPAPGDYKINAPETMAGMFEPEHEGFRGFVEAAHKAGFSQHQMDVAMGAFFENAQRMARGVAELDAAECNAKLAEVWANPGEREANMQAAVRAMNTFGGERAQNLMAAFGNNPDAIWLLAQVGKGLREDSPVSGASAPNASQRTPAQMLTDMKSTDPTVRQKAEKEFAAWTEAQAATSQPILG